MSNELPRNAALLQPEATAPLDTWVMILHVNKGLIEGYKSSEMVNSDSLDEPKFPWDTPGSESWLYRSDIAGWMPHPMAQMSTAQVGNELGNAKDVEG